ncbi:hypothetical protein HLB23_26135 [Nocardia uniformis]|uniref:Uncharacterized protein n=1 Tax=Nocardia uniformis TaxID=53432 RepID=A0A849C3J9_9NOCA|nr:hypothetical protein [Nocardia uniformis]NNH73293.1 hypothetical protein [Nocardia uniformis]
MTEVRVRLRFPGGMVLDYRTEPMVAERLAAHLRPHRIEVTIHGQAPENLPPLPCAALWRD